MCAEVLCFVCVSQWPKFYRLKKHCYVLPLVLGNPTLSLCRITAAVNQVAVSEIVKSIGTEQYSEEQIRSMFVLYNNFAEMILFFYT